MVAVVDVAEVEAVVAADAVANLSPNAVALHPRRLRHVDAGAEEEEDAVGLQFYDNHMTESFSDLKRVYQIPFQYKNYLWAKQQTDSKSFKFNENVMKTFN